MPEIVFHPDVATEVKATYQWYQNRAEKLGDDLLYELEAAYQAIIELPDTWPKFNLNYRRFILAKFPFSIIYRRNNDAIFVVEIMHNSRKPGYWENRTDE